MVKSLFHKVFQSNFAKNVLIMGGGTAGAQILGAVFSPIITRIYTPEEYGVLSLFVTILGLIAITASFKYEDAIPIAGNDEQAINVLGLSFLILLVYVAFSGVLFSLFGNSILSFLDAQALINYKFLIPIGVFFVGNYNILMRWGFRKKNFKAISQTKLTQSITGNVLKIVLGLFGIKPHGLLIGQIVSQGAGATTLLRPLVQKDKFLLKKINRIKVIESAKRYKNFPIFYVPDQLLNFAGLQLPVFFISFLYGTEILGLYSLANSIINLPMSLIGQSVGDVFFSEAANIGSSNPKRVKDLSLNLFKKLFVIGLVPLLVLLFFGPFLFSFVFGPEWYLSGVYARILSVLIFSRLIFTPISRVYTIYERLKEQLLVDLLRVVLIIMVFSLAHFFSLNSFLYITLNSFAVIIQYFIGFLVAQRILNQEIKKKENV